MQRLSVAILVAALAASEAAFLASKPATKKSAKTPGCIGRIHGGKLTLLVQGDPVPEEMANSEMISGPDCGAVRKIFAKWKKSKDVGKLGGAARNVIEGADRAAEQATVAKEKAKKAAKAAKSVGGSAAVGAAEDAEKAARKAKKASEKASSTSSSLDTALDDLKENVGNTPWETSTKKINKVIKKKDQATEATKDAVKAAEVALEMAEEATKVALSSADAALKMVATLAKDSEEAADLAAETKKEAGWAVTECGKVLEGADKVIEKLNDKINDDKGDQGPVFKAFKGKLQKGYDSAENAKTALQEEIPKLQKAIDDLNKAAEPIMDKKAQMADGSGDNKGMGALAEDMDKLDGKLRAVGEVTEKVSFMLEDLQKKKERVTKLGEEASEFDIPWKPPPATPLGAKKSHEKL